MKRYTILLLTTIGLSLSLFSQEKSARNSHEEAIVNQEMLVTIHVKERPVTEVLRLIEQQTNHTFSYSPTLLQGFPPITLAITNQPLAHVLKLIFNETEVLPVVQEKYIILKSDQNRSPSAGSSTTTSRTSRSSPRTCTTTIRPWCGEQQPRFYSLTALRAKSTFAPVM